ncbi:hypothetical protein NIES4101_53490 [Calothrix sp. NIES-4101]|nr:hypothetical protein NIES4101_53490 [Calothrix sp. NIES-4101]
MAASLTENEYRAIGLYLVLNFADRIRITDTQALLDIKSVLEEQYTDGITAIPEAYIDGDILVGVFEDRVDAKLTKRYRFEIGEDFTSYRMLNPVQADNFIEFAAKSGAKAKNCTKGTPCGGSCVSSKKTCRKNNSAGAKKKVENIKGKAAGGDKPATKSTATNDGLLKAKQTNPFAKPNLTTDQFNEFRRNRDFVNEHKNPDFVGNKTYEQWKGDNPKAVYSPARYKGELLAAIRNGYVVDDKVIQAAKLKLNKSEERKLQENKQNLTDRTKSIAEIQKAIDHPLVDAETAKKYKPKMTEAEAEDYVKGSYTGNLSFYHGNTVSVTSSVENDGVDPSKNAQGIFGRGFYLASNKRESEDYAYSSGSQKSEEASVVTAKVNVKNPLILESKDFDLFGSKFPGNESNNVDSTAIAEFAKAKGHDSIYLKDFGYFVALDGKQVVTYKNEPLTEKRKKEIKEDRITSTDDVANRASESETGKTLAKAEKNEIE